MSTPQARASSRRQNTTSPPSTPRKPGATGDPAAADLERRFQAAQQAATQGNPDAVIAANKKLAALALRQLGGLRLFENAAPQALENLRESLALEDNAETRLSLAAAALNSQKPEETLAQATHVTAGDPENSRAWFLIGKAQIALENYPEALKALEHSSRINDDANTRFALALTYLRMKDQPHAQAIFDRMLADYGDRAIWHVIIAGAYRESENNDEAAREFRRAIAMDNTVDHAHFFLGLTLLQQNHWAQTEASMAEFREAARLHPDDYSANFYIGAGEAEWKMFDSSNRHLRIAAEKQPDVPEVWLYLGLNAFQQNDFASAKTSLLKAIELTGKDEARNNYQLKRAYISLSRIAFNAGDKEAAQRYSQKAREMQNASLAVSAESISATMDQGGMGAAQAAAMMPHSNLPREEAQAPEAVDPTAQVSTSGLDPERAKQAEALEQRLRKILGSSFNDWGTAEARQGMFSFALEHFQEAEKWDKSTPGLMRNIGLAALKVNNIPEAIRGLQEAVKTEPENRQLRVRLAMLLYGDSRYAEAAQQFDALGDAAFEDPGVAYAWGYSLVRVNEQKQAVAVLERLTKFSLPADVLVSVGDLYGVLQLYEPAIACYRKALQEDPGLSNVHYKLGASLIRLDHMADAVSELQEALKSTPDDPDVQFNMAYALLQTSQKDKAIALLQTVIQKHPDHPQAQYELGKTLLEECKADVATPHLEIAAKLDPARDYVHYQLQVAYRRVGRTADSDNELKIYREIKARKRDNAAIPQTDQKP